MKKIALNLIKQKFSLNEKDISIYLYGSRIYGTNKENSDYDYLIINKKINNQEIKHKIVNLHLYTEEHFQEILNEHKIVALEVYFYNNINNFIFNLDLQKLRKSISEKASNSWVKCKKKLTVEQGEYYIGIKSLFHSIRIIEFGIQIAKYGEIKDYSSANYILEKLNSQYWTWDEINEYFKPIYNKKMSEFRELAPKS